MVDKLYCMSAFLALRYIEKRGVNFTDELPYRRPELKDGEKILVRTAADVDEALARQIEPLKKKYHKIGMLLSGGMDSSVLASYLSGCDAYTFRFLGGSFQSEELHRAERFADYYGLTLHYVDISWESVTRLLPAIMRSKGGPVHSIEPQICQAALQAKQDGVDLMIIGDGSDYVFGGMDQLLSKDWGFDEFMHRCIYVEPEEVLVEPQSMQYLFERYRMGERIDFMKFYEIVVTEESYGSYENAFHAADLDYFDPYEDLKMAEPLDLKRVRSGESKYLIRELFRMKYPEIPVPEKLPMPRPVDAYFKTWTGPTRPEFRGDIDMSRYTGNQKWLIWCLEQFLNSIDE